MACLARTFSVDDRHQKDFDLILALVGTVMGQRISNGIVVVYIVVGVFAVLFAAPLVYLMMSLT